MKPKFNISLLVFFTLYTNSKKQNYIFNITNPIIKKSRINGNKTNNQDKVVCPSLQIKFNTYVQNKMYTNLIKKTIVVFGTLQ
jgi:hypothetical protein